MDAIPTSKRLLAPQSASRQEEATDVHTGLTSTQAEIAAELLGMGFEGEIVTEAVKRHSTVGAAVDWILEMSATVAQGMTTMSLRAPTTLRNLNSVVATSEDMARNRGQSPTT